MHKITRRDFVKRGSMALTAVTFLQSLAVQAAETIGQCVIIRQSGASVPEQNAAQELASCLKTLTGRTFAIEATAPDHVPAAAIVIGQGPVARKLHPEFNLEELGPEEFVVCSKGQRLLLAGGRPRGTLYAVYHFLQQQHGVRWWTPWAADFPHQTSFHIPSVNQRQAPAFEYRAPYWFDGFDSQWEARNRVNAGSQIAANLGGWITYAGKGFVHTFYKLVPPDKYFAAHPEWYSLINGKRTDRYLGGQEAQLCLSNAQLRDFVVTRVKAWLRESPDASIVSVSQNDVNGAECQCPKCKAIDDAQGSPSGSVIAFVNYIAEKIEPEFPNVAVDTLAYQYTRKPPKTLRPRPNVIVRLCSIECNFREPFDDPSNASFLNDLKRWSKICHRLYIWDYTTDFSNYLLPYPNWFTLGPNMRILHKFGVKGVFEEGDYQNYGAEMGELRTWLLAQLLWDPHQDDRVLIQQFLEGYYGKSAAKPIHRYLELMHQASKGFYLGCSTKPHAPFRTFKVLSKAERFWQEAEKVSAADPERLIRVRMGHLPVRLAFLRNWANLRKQCEKNKSTWPLPESRKTVAEQFGEVCKGAPGKDWSRVTRLNEGGLTVEKFLQDISRTPS